MCSELGWPNEDVCFEKEKKKQNKTGHPFTFLAVKKAIRMFQTTQQIKQNMLFFGYLY